MEQAASNRREFFRLGFHDLPGTMQIFEVQENPISVEPRPVVIVNLGGGGLYMRTEIDIPIRQGVYATFAFELEGQRFAFRGHLIRKTDDMAQYWYAVTFVDVEEPERGALLSALGRIQIDRSRQGRAMQA